MSVLKTNVTNRLNIVHNDMFSSSVVTVINKLTVENILKQIVDLFIGL